jgi:sugar phosphate isomerase/epimerase
MAKLKTIIAAQLFTLRDHLKTPGEVVKTLARLRKIGYDHAQISGVCPMDPAELRKIMMDADVEPIGAHIGINQFRDAEKKVIADCHAWGVQYVAIPWLSRENCKTLADWKKLFKEMDGYAKRLKTEGIVVQYHNHMFEFEKFGVKNGTGGKTILDMLYENTQHLEAELDFGWIVRGGHCPVAWAKKLKGRLGQVHLKDWGVIDNNPVWREIGEGGIDWVAVYKACKASGTTDFIIEQDNWPATNDPFLSLAISLKNLKAMGIVQK